MIRVASYVLCVRRTSAEKGSGKEEGNKMVTGRRRRSMDGKFARVKILVCSPVSRQLHRCLIAMRGGKRRWVKITVALSALFLPLAVSAPAFA